MQLSPSGKLLLVAAVLSSLLLWLCSSGGGGGTSGAPKPSVVVLPSAVVSPSFWDTFGRVEVFVLTINETLNRWRHLRDVVSTGPWPATLVEGCTTSTPEVAKAIRELQPKRQNLQPKPVALVCSHVRAVQEAKRKDLDYAVILEDDAQFIPDFWRRLELRLRVLPPFGVFYLQHSSSENILRLDKRNLLFHGRRPVARRYNAHEVFALGAGAFDGVLGTIWDAGGYMLSRKGIDEVMKQDIPGWLRSARGSFGIYSSEMVLSVVADAHGAFFSIPPLAYQCTSKASLIQNEGKAYIDKVGRMKQKELFSAILRQGEPSNFSRVSLTARARQRKQDAGLAAGVWF